MKKMGMVSRIIIAIGSLAMCIMFFVPAWSIYLIAPQYPEGLSMQIWLYKITGQVEIINGLNHYIGMKHIKEDMFPEFSFLIYILGFFVLFGLAVAVTGSRKWLLGYLVLSVIAGISALVDFYMWGYDYGHNLDPSAAIQVAGLSYQPPLIGHKKLLNFDAYSYPDIGGWIVIGVGVIFFLVWIYGIYKNRKKAAAINSLKKASPIIAIVFFFVSSCNTKPEPFVIGKDVCDDCKMTIMDGKFGGEIITKKGKIYKFDDAHCAAHFLKTSSVKTADIANTVFIDYENKGTFLDVKSLYFVVSPNLKSPMNSNAAAFTNKAIADKIAAQNSGEVKSWDALLKTL